MRGWAILLAAALATPALADPTTPPAALADTQLRDPAQEAKARALMETLRCVVCQGQSIADSDASMAGDMRAPSSFHFNCRLIGMCRIANNSSPAPALRSKIVRRSLMPTSGRRY
jgi:hypothetical protein